MSTQTVVNCVPAASTVASGGVWLTSVHPVVVIDGGVDCTTGGAGGAATTGTLSVFWVDPYPAATHPNPSAEYWVEIFTCHH
ncbi:MAG: hypothetical protein FIA98_09945 [Anaerolineae bacterium]|nr:hypothetical protein [Anaerolineae bacterium]